MLLLFGGAALGIVDHLRRRFARFKLCAHFLQARSKRFNLLLLLCYGRFQSDRRFLFRVISVPAPFVLFEELIEQHRVHLVVAHAVGLSFLVAHHQVGIHLFYVLGHKSELRCACRINLLLVTEA